MTTDHRTVAELLASLRATWVASYPDKATSPLAELDMLQAAHERAVREAVLRERIECTRLVRDELMVQLEAAPKSWQATHTAWTLQKVLRAIERRGADE